MGRRSLLAMVVACALACASNDPAGEPEAAPSAQPRPDELLDCSVEYGALPSVQSWVRAINDVAGSYLAAQRLHEQLRRDPNATSEEVEEAWRARAVAAQTLLRACRCWDQLDRLAYERQVLAAQSTSTKQLKAEVGRFVGAPCQKVFEAESATSGDGG